MQLRQVSSGQLPHDPVTLRSQADTDDPAVVPVRHPLHHARGLSPVYQLHCAVRAQQQVAGEITNRGRRFCGVSFDRHQELMLDVGQARSLRLVFAKALEAAQGDANSSSFSKSCRLGLAIVIFWASLKAQAAFTLANLAAVRYLTSKVHSGIISYRDKHYR